MFESKNSIYIRQLYSLYILLGQALWTLPTLLNFSLTLWLSFSWKDMGIEYGLSLPQWEGKLTLKNCQKEKYSAKSICIFVMDCTVFYSCMAHVKRVGISAHAFLSALRSDKREEHLVKASMEAPEAFVTCGSLKYRILTSCWCHCTWKESRPEGQRLRW